VASGKLWDTIEIGRDQELQMEGYHRVKTIST
jgi:hypothetical protein